MSKRKKILIVLAILFALPVTLMISLFGWARFSDKTNGAMVSSGVTRRYLLYVPKIYDRSKATPLLISFHPALTWPAAQMAISRWNDLADKNGFIVVYPAGTGVPFRGLGPGPNIFKGQPPDFRFISDLIDKLETEYHIDPDRIYANGLSNGGAMAFGVSCNLPERIAAVGIVAGAQVPWNFAKTKPLPTVVFHGTADRIVPCEGGFSFAAPWPFPNVPNWTAQVAQRNQCTGDPIDTRMAPNVRRRSYADNAKHADVTLYTLEGGGHTWPGGRHLPEWLAGRTIDDFDASRVMWDFFVQHPRRPN